MIPNKSYVYLSRRPCGEVFYVGIGNRKGRHTAAHNNRHYNNIVRKGGCTVRIIHENLTWAEACELEKFYIIRHKETIVNLTEGGEGALGYKHTKTSKAKMSASSKKAWIKRKLNKNSK